MKKNPVEKSYVIASFHKITKEKYGEKIAETMLYKKVPKIAKSFSEEAGFQYGGISCSKRAWSADILRCPYYEACKRFDCPQIAHYFCDSDDLIYGSLHERVLWKRTKTLGRGQEVCDFHVEVR